MRKRVNFRFHMVMAATGMCVSLQRACAADRAHHGGRRYLAMLLTNWGNLSTETSAIKCVGRPGRGCRLRVLTRRGWQVSGRSGRGYRVGQDRVAVAYHHFVSLVSATCCAGTHLLTSPLRRTLIAPMVCKDRDFS